MHAERLLRQLRPLVLRLVALTACTTTGIPAKRPTLSLALRIRSRRLAPCLRKRAALARSIRCGKSTFHSCGGTYGHLLMKHMSQSQQ